ncbi:MAG: hydrolase [Legionellales bacterium]|nr:hydrolase [Legionellales bacterium]
MEQKISTWLKQQYPDMIARLLAWSEINSGTFNLAGLNRMVEVLEPAFAELNAQSDHVDLPPYDVINDHGQITPQPLGKLLSWVKRPEAPIQILLCGHMDTVYDLNHPFQSCSYINDQTLNGPGVADMKGGVLVMLYALQALEQFADVSQIGWRVMINPDEEIGSPGSANWMRKWAPDYHYALVYEPSLTPEGFFAGQRKGSGNFSFVVHGLAAHVGRAFDQGKNAIVGLAHLTQALNALNQQREGVTINIGYCHGGGPVNIVPALAIAKLNVRTLCRQDEFWFYEQLECLLDTFQAEYGMQVDWYGQFGRPPKIMDEKQTAFYTLLAEVSKEMGLTAHWEATGGCCDGNNFAAMGLPTIDTLGVRGGAIHTDKEFIVLDSLIERAELTVRLLMKLSNMPQK